jgi:hypothetical protein
MVAALVHPPGFRLGVDVGVSSCSPRRPMNVVAPVVFSSFPSVTEARLQGTFTDVCVVTPTGASVRAKAPSTSPDQSLGVKQAIEKARRMLETNHGWSGKFDFIHHGTTVGRFRSPILVEGLKTGSRSALTRFHSHKCGSPRQGKQGRPRRHRGL